jgi:hypothetical protein
MVQEAISIKHPIVKYSFALANIQDSQTGTAVPMLGGVLNAYIMPLNGSIVGYAINYSASLSAGSTDFDLLVAGTSTLTIAADTTSTYKLIEEGVEPFAAGQTLSVSYTTDGNVEANTVDVVVDVFVVLRDFEF